MSQRGRLATPTITPAGPPYLALSPTPLHPPNPTPPTAISTAFVISSRVLVLDAGRVVEDGEPHDLLLRDEGIFGGMVDQTGASSSRYLRDVARGASFTRSAARGAAADAAVAAADAAGARSSGSVALGAPYFGPDDRGRPGGAVAAALRRGHGADGGDRSDDEDGGGGGAAAAAAQARIARHGGPVPYVRTGSMVTDPLGAAMAATVNFEREMTQLRQAAASGELDRLTRRGSAEAQRASMERRGSQDSMGAAAAAARSLDRRGSQDSLASSTAPAAGGAATAARPPALDLQAAPGQQAAAVVEPGTVASIAGSLERRGSQQTDPGSAVASPRPEEGPTSPSPHGARGGWLNR
jgi:hypothetical protein